MGESFWLMLLVNMCLGVLAHARNEQHSQYIIKRSGHEPMTFRQWSHVIATQWSNPTQQWPGKQASREAPNVDHQTYVLTTKKENGIEAKVEPLLDDVEMEHQKARERLELCLTLEDVWHFMLGYTDLRALKVAERVTQEAILHHYPTRDTLQFVSTFISKATANLLKKNSIFRVVEPLVPALKIEDLTLGRVIRGLETGEEMESSLMEPVSLKARLAEKAVSISETKQLALQWEEAIQTILKYPSASSRFPCCFKTMRYTVGNGQNGIDEAEHVDRQKIAHGGFHHKDGPKGREDQEFVSSPREETDCFLRRRDVIPEEKEAQNFPPDSKQDEKPVVTCEVEVETAIVCSPITKTALKVVAKFMTEHAVVQLVEINPRYQVFNKWAKYVTQVHQLV